MQGQKVVPSDEWVQARKRLLAKEKELTRLRDEVTRARQELPWERVEKDYRFQGPDGPVSLGELFDGCSQLLVYHFMFGPDWSEGCKICSMLADHYDPLRIHLRQRDVTLVTVSRAALDTIESYRRRMGWQFRWVSSLESDFNWDYQASFTQEQLDAGQVYYNYVEGPAFPATEGPGISAFLKDDTGAIFHTYSSYGRGLEDFLGIYRFLDIVPKGRNEEGLPYPMAWVRQKDRYDDETFVEPYSVPARGEG